MHFELLKLEQQLKTIKVLISNKRKRVNLNCIWVKKWSEHHVEYLHTPKSNKITVPEEVRTGASGDGLGGRVRCSFGDFTRCGFVYWRRPRRSELSTYIIKYKHKSCIYPSFGYLRRYNNTYTSRDTRGRRGDAATPSSPAVREWELWRDRTSPSPVNWTEGTLRVSLEEVFFFVANFFLSVYRLWCLFR